MSASSAFQLQTESQHRLHQQLVNVLGQGPAALYLDAVRMLTETPPYISSTHLVAHLLREIESSLRRVLLPYDYPPPAECPCCHHKPEVEGHKKQIEAIVSIYSLDKTTSAQWIALATGSKEHDHGFAAFAHRDALTLPRPLNDACQQMMAMFEQVLFVVLDAFERQSLHIYTFLDELLAKVQPGKDDVSKLKNKIPANWATYSYFFSRLENPIWLRPLSQKNAFAIPSEDVVEGYLRYSPWPQAVYLKKMATQGQEVQEQVLGILVTVANTNNPLAQQAILEIAQLLPAHLSAQLTPFVNTWIAEPGRHSFVSAELQQFIAHLIQGEQVNAAIAVFKALLLVMSTNDPYVERWDYEHLLFDPLPALVMSAPRELLDVLCTLLDQDIYRHYIRFRKPDAEDAAVYDRAREASSITWLPTFEATEHMHVRGTQSLVLLAIALRKAAEQAINDGYLSVPETLALLDTHAGKIFKRLTLYVLSQFASTDLTLARSWLMTRALFDDADLRHEYSLLAQVTLPHLTKEEQATWLQWIEEGPDLETYKQWHQRTYQALSGDIDIQQSKAVWQRNWFGRIEKVLPDEWRIRYDELVAQYGAYEQEFRLTSWPAAMRTSSQDAYRNTTVEQWLQKLDASQDNQGDLQEDALLSLTALITEAPERFANQVHLFEGQPPEVIKAVIRGLVRAAQVERAFDWYQVLRLCAWVIEQRRPSGEEENDKPSRDPAWASVTFEVALLFLATFEKLPSQLPYSSRGTIWQLLAALADDPYYLSKAKKETTPQHYYSDAINSTRGIALQAVISYAWWVMANWKEARDPQEKTGWDLNQAPEVRELLEQRLFGRGDRSPIVHAVCGRLLLWLAQLDEQWTTQHLNDIFPHDAEDRDCYEAAWTTYLFQRSLTRRIFTLVKDEYVFAIEQLQRADKQEISRDTANYYLARHLLIAYWNECITIEDGEDSLLSLFFQRASGSLRQSFMAQVGQTCAHEEQPIDPQVIERFQRLWEWRVATITQSHLDPETARELAGFSWWMACESFPAIWAVQHLDYVLARVDSIEMSSFVVCRLTECITEAPLVTLRCLDHLVRGTTTSWGSKEWKTVEALLALAFQQERPELHDLAKAIISYLALHGHTQMLNLLPRT